MKQWLDHQNYEHFAMTSRKEAKSAIQFVWSVTNQADFVHLISKASICFKMWRSNCLMQDRTSEFVQLKVKSEWHHLPLSSKPFLTTASKTLRKSIFCKRSNKSSDMLMNCMVSVLLIHKTTFRKIFDLLEWKLNFSPIEPSLYLVY